MPFSAGGSEIRPYRIRVVRWVGRATSPRRPLSRWELSSSCHVVLGGRLGDPPLPNPFCAMSWWGRISEAAVIPMGAQFFLPCRSRRAARRSAPAESILRDELVGPHLRGGRYPDGSSVLPAMSFSAGGSEIRPCRIHFAR